MPPSRNSVLVAMSGGVDSSVAAAMLLETGYEVTGLFFRLPGAKDAGEARPIWRHAEDARRAAKALGIELIELDLSGSFAPVMEYFADEYARGRTPNPCVLCNERIKFARLTAEADARKSVASRPDITRDSTATPQRRRYAALAAGAKTSHTHCTAFRETRVRRLLLPIGEFDGKDEVRRKARQLALDVHDKPDSQEICFIPDDDYVSWLRRNCPEALQPGNIVSAAGEVLGTHDGYAQFTVGQRRGLHMAVGVPMYVTRIDPDTGAVTVGTRAETLARRLTASGANWQLEPPADGFEAVVQIRYNHAGEVATVSMVGDSRFEVEFDEPVHAITPGQAVVVYDGDRLMGGGWID